jgi:tetratricopeptide (TPR) repeat protein
LLWTGLLGEDLADLGTAREALEESLALYREVGDTAGIVQALRELGLCLMSQGELSDRTRAILDESFTLARASGDRRSMGMALERLGLLAGARHDYRQAQECLMEARGHYRQIGDVWAEGSSLMLTGFIALAQGDLELARQDLAASLAIARRTRDRQREAQVVVLTARLARKEGDDRRAEALLKDNLRRIGDNGTFYLQSDALSSLAKLAVGQGKFARGARLFAAASALDPVSSGPWYVTDLSV